MSTPKAFDKRLVLAPLALSVIVLGGFLGRVRPVKNRSGRVLLFERTRAGAERSSAGATILAPSPATVKIVSGWVRPLTARLSLDCDRSSITTMPLATRPASVSQAMIGRDGSGAGLQIGEGDGGVHEGEVGR